LFGLLTETSSIACGRAPESAADRKPLAVLHRPQEGKTRGVREVEGHLVGFVLGLERSLMGHSSLKVPAKEPILNKSSLEKKNLEFSI